jgi:hypothetical protein
MVGTKSCRTSDFGHFQIWIDRISDHANPRSFKSAIALNNQNAAGTEITIAIVLIATAMTDHWSSAGRLTAHATAAISARAGTPATKSLEASGVKRHCRLASKEESFIENAAKQLCLSPCGFQRVLKVARTIADLDGAENINRNHLAEAIGFRQPGTS